MRRSLLALAVVAAIALAATVGFAVGRGTAPSPVTRAAAPTGSVGSTGSADGVESTRFVSYHGLTLSVPVSWDYSYSGCVGPDDSGVVVMQPGPVSCSGSGTVAGAAPPSNPVLVLLQSGATDAGLARPVVVAGIPASRAVAPDAYHPGRVVVTFSFAGPGFTISVSAPTEAVADGVVATAFRTSTDPDGCDQQLPADLHNKPAAQIVPATPFLATVCDYDSPHAQDGGQPWLVGSRRLTDAELHDLTTRLENAPAYTAPAPTTPTGNGPFPKRYLLRYPDNSTRVVDVRNDGDAADLGASNPVVGSDGTHRVLLDTDGSWQPPGAFDS